LAQALGISRNKVAAYEGSQSEPKLGLLLSLAQHFEVPVDALATRDLSRDEELALVREERKGLRKMGEVSTWSSESQIGFRDASAIEEFIAKNHQVAKMVDGFKAFQKIRTQSDDPKINNKTLIGAENLIYLLDYLVESNKKLISSLDNP